MRDEILKQELIKNIMSKFGITTSLERKGIVFDEFKAKEKLKIETDNYIENKDIYVATADLLSDKLKAAFVSIDDEFILAFRLNDLNIFLLKIFNSDWSKNLNYKSLFYIMYEDKFREASKYEQLISAAGAEKVADFGVIWRKSDNYQDLYDAIIKFLEI